MHTTKYLQLFYSSFFLPKMYAHLVLALLAVLASYFYSRLYYKRFHQFASLPQLSPTLLGGHLGKFNEYSQLGPKDRHPGQSLQ